MTPKQFTILIKTLTIGFGWVTESNVLPSMWGTSGASRAKEYASNMGTRGDALIEEALELDPKRPAPLSPDRAAAAAAGAEAATLARNAELADTLTGMIEAYRKGNGVSLDHIKAAEKVLAGAGS